MLGTEVLQHYRCPVCGGQRLTGQKATVCDGRIPATPLVRLYCPDCEVSKTCHVSEVKTAVFDFARQIRIARS